jgi:hypothetical protein
VGERGREWADKGGCWRVSIRVDQSGHASHAEGEEFCRHGTKAQTGVGSQPRRTLSTWERSARRPRSLTLLTWLIVLIDLLLQDDALGVASHVRSCSKQHVRDTNEAPHHKKNARCLRCRGFHTPPTRTRDNGWECAVLGRDLRLVLQAIGCTKNQAPALKYSVRF